jgi:uncharacterized damage-inducible protein DinB
MKNKTLEANARHSRLVEDLFREIAPFGDERLNQKPANGGWSAMQVLHHLILVEENSLRYVRKKLSFEPNFKKTGLAAHLRMKLLLFTLRLPIKFRAPASASSEKIPEKADFDETVERWRKVRAEWTDFFEKMPENLADKATYRHPRAGRISFEQMTQFFSGHFKRHRDQIRRSLK